MKLQPTQTKGQKAPVRKTNRRELKPTEVAGALSLVHHGGCSFRDVEGVTGIPKSTINDR